MTLRALSLAPDRLRARVDRLELPRWLLVAWPWVAAALLAWLTWPLGDIAPSAPGGGDPGWQAGIHIAADRGLDFGNEIMFTYGPLGFLAVPAVYFGWTALLALLYTLLVQVAFCVVLLRAALNSYPALIAVPLVFLIAGLPFNHVDKVPLIVFVLSVLALERGFSHWPSRALVPMLGAVCAFQMLLKFNTGLIALVIAAVAVWLVRPGSWRAELLLAASFTLSFVLLWLLLGNPLSGIVRWLRGSAELAAGYAGALAREEGGREWEYFAAAVLLILLGSLVRRHGQHYLRERRLVLYAATFVLAFAYFKQGFVRHDGDHSELFFGASVVGFAAFSWSSALRWKALASVGAAITALLIAQTRTGDAAVALLKPFDRPHAAIDQLRTMMNQAERAQLANDGRTRIVEWSGIDGATIESLRDRTVHVDPQEASLVWALGVAWRPVPVFQAYAAFTEYLDERNAEVLESSDPPQRILRQYLPERIGGRSPELESPAYYLAIICNYRELHSTETWQVLAFVGDRCGQPTRLSSIQAEPDAVVAVPDSGDGALLLARFSLPASVPDKLRSALYKPGVTPTLAVDDGPARPLVAATAVNPIVLSLPATAGYAARYGGGLDAETIRISGVDSPIGIDFFQMAVHRFAGNGAGG